MMLVCSMLLGTLTASAQFTVYRSAEDQSYSAYTPSMGYGVPFTVYRPAEVEPYYYGQQQYQQRQPARPKMHEVTLRGYFKKGNNWYYMPIRVGVIGEEVRLLSVKQQSGWSNCGSVASQVGAFDSEVIRDNFNYMAYSTQCGMVYF